MRSGGKLGWLAWYPRDWTADPKLALTSIATRGIWFELLNFMTIEGTDHVIASADELGRLVRAETPDVTRFLRELECYKFGDVTNCNGVYTIVSRRLRRELKDRENTRERVRRHRARQSAAASNVTPLKPVETETESETDTETERKEGPSDLVPNGTQNGATRKPKAPDPDTLKPEDLQESWNEHLAPLGLPRVAELSGTRRKKALARLHEHPKIGFWEQVIGNIRGSPFLRGLRPKPGHENWRASFDWLIENDTNAVKVYEGRYGAG